MSSGEPPVEMRKLTLTERRAIERRERRYRDKLTRLGYTTRALVDETGCFGVVLVEDPELLRKGLLLPDGTIRWIEQALLPGALADAAVSGVTKDGIPLTPPPER